jgi:spermidine synthase
VARDKAVSAWLPLAVVAMSGFISLSYEILWFRAISFVTGTRPQAFGLLLGFYLGGLAIGAWASGRICRSERGVGNRVYLMQIALFVLLANAVGYSVLPSLAWLVTGSGWGPALGLIALSSAMLGAILPLVSHFAIMPDRYAGKYLSHLYAANIVGSVLGSFLTGFVLLDLWPIRTNAGLLAGLGCSVALAVIYLARASRRVLAVSTALTCALFIAIAGVTPMLFAQFYERLLYGPRFTPAVRLADVVENRSGVIAVTKGRVVYGGGAYDGRISTSLTDDRNKIERAYAVAGLHPAPRDVLMIGMSTGAWAQVLVNNPSVETLTIIEINPGYLQLVRKYPQVSSLLRNPKVKVVIDDGRRWLTRNRAKFDLVVANTTIHWRAHTTNLLSVEYNSLIQAHLKPDGVYYFNTTGSESVLKTAMITFPYGLRFMNFAAVSLSPIELDRDRYRQALETYRIDGAPVLDLNTPADRATIETLVNTSDVESREDILHRLEGTPIVTDDNMLPEWHPTLTN